MTRPSNAEPSELTIRLQIFADHYSKNRANQDVEAMSKDLRQMESYIQAREQQLPPPDQTMLDKISAITGIAPTSDQTARLAGLFIRERWQLLTKLLNQKVTRKVISSTEVYEDDFVPVSVIEKYREEL